MLRLIAAGGTNKDAAAVGISAKTVMHHGVAVHRKLGVCGRAEAAAYGNDLVSRFPRIAPCDDASSNRMHRAARCSSIGPTSLRPGGRTRRRASGWTRRADVPTMYHASGKQRGTAGSNGHLTRCPDQAKIGSYQGERLTTAEGS